MGQLLDNFREIWRRVGLFHRVALVAILLASLGAVALLVGWAQRPSMSLLYSNLAPEEAARIVEKISDADIPYQLKEGGTAVYVPQKEVYSLRLTMAGEGLPVGDQAGYRILDNPQIGASPFFQRVSYIRAIEGELAKTIQTLDGVVSARVHIVRPEATLFNSEQSRASATVALRLRAGQRLMPANVAAVVHLLAGGVEGLQPNDVVVVDSQGNLLSGGDDDSLARKAGTFLEYKSQLEKYYAEKAESMLSAVLGPNRASVRVSAEIDTSTVEVTSENYDPTGQVASREDIKTKSSQSGSQEEGAAPPESEKEETITTEFAVSKTIRREVELPGRVTSLTVAALVDLTPPPAAEGEEQPAPTATLTVEAIKEVIQKALGLAGVENITVREASFYQPVVAEAVEPEGGLFSKDTLLEIARRSSLGLLTIGALLALKIFGGAKKGVAAAQAPALQGQGVQGGNLLPGGATTDAELLQASISNALQQNPEEVKRLFANWVNPEKGEV